MPDLSRNAKMEYAIYTSTIELVQANLNADDELILQSFLLRKQAKNQLEAETGGTVATLTFAADGDAQDKMVYYGVYSRDSSKPQLIICFITSATSKMELFLHELDYVARLCVQKHDSAEPFDVSSWHLSAIDYLPRIVKLAGDKLPELLHTCFCSRKLQIEAEDNSTSSLVRSDLELFKIACPNSDWLEEAVRKQPSANGEVESQTSTITVRIHSKNGALSLQLENAQKNDFFSDVANQMRTLYSRARVTQQRSAQDSASPEKRAGAPLASTSSDLTSETTATSEKDNDRQPKTSQSSLMSDSISVDEREKLIDARERSISESDRMQAEVQASVAFELKQMVEHARLHIAQDLNTLKRLLSLAEASYPDLYRCYQFVRRSPNRDVLCEHVRRYASLYSEEASQLIDLFDECMAMPRLALAS